MRRLGRPLRGMATRTEVVVVGSGYGGAVAACRLARAGREVVLLERGREVHPGEYPATAAEAVEHVQVTGPDGLRLGDGRGLFWFHLGGDVEVLSGCGLGGTSLVNAGVCLRPTPDVFDERWPAELRSPGPGRLPDGVEAGLRAAEAMLTPRTYPERFPRLGTVDALAVAAGRRGTVPTPVAVTFRTGRNAAGVEQHACTGCGDCVTGCNVAAKNTVLMNYLPDAVDHGATLVTEVDVRTVLPAPGGGWEVAVRDLSDGADRGATTTVTADLVVLAGGTLGTTGILLRSAGAGLPVSDHLGGRLSANGDALGFAERPGVDVRGVGSGDRVPDPEAPAGPCITAMIDGRDGAGLDDRSIVENAVIPGALAPLVAGALVTQLGAGPQPHLRRLAERWAAARSLLHGGRGSGTDHLQTLLHIGGDDAGGRVVLAGGEAAVRWPGSGDAPWAVAARARLAEVAGAGGGTVLQDPVTVVTPDHAQVTVHPLGGCPAGDGPEDGVVDHRGRVFVGGGGGAVHDGLLVVDGSAVPGAVGVNPLLTISALAERAMALLCADRGWPFDPVPVNPLGPGDPRPDPPHVGLRAHEAMAGWWSPDGAGDGGAGGALAPFLAAEAAGRDRPDHRLSFALTLATDDLPAVVEDLATPLAASGEVVAPLLSPTPLRVVDGSVALLVPDDPTDPLARHMHYVLTLEAGDGRRYLLDGVKVVEGGDAAQVWGATTTLYVRVDADGPTRTTVGHGVVRIDLAGVARLVRSLHVTGSVSRLERLEYEGRFALAFAGPLVRAYGSVLPRTVPSDPPPVARTRRRLALPEEERYEVRTADGVVVRLTRYPGPSAPVLLSPGTASTSRVFTLDTVTPSAAEQLSAAGFDVWLQDWRTSIDLPSVDGQCTADEVARADHPACAAKIRDVTGVDDLHVVAHCVGSMTWLMATLEGRVDPSSLLCSAVGLHPVAPVLTRLKVDLHLSELLQAAGVDLLTSASTGHEPLRSRALDAVLRAEPVPDDERCDRAVCRRLAFLYGVPVHHAAVDDVTHGALAELFGVTNLTLMSHLSTMARRELVVDAAGDDVYLPHLERLRRPVTFLHGDRNLVWLPDSTRRTYELLVDTFGQAGYERAVVAGYGHTDVWIGAAAHRDTLPVVVDHLDRVGARPSPTGR